MTAQLELDFGRPAPAPVQRPETPRERALRLTNGTGRMPLEQALDLAMPNWRRTGVKFIDPRTLDPERGPDA